MHVALSLVVAVAGLVVPSDGPDGPPPPPVLLVIDWEAGPLLAYPETGITAPLASARVEAEWCGTCGVVAVGGRVFSAQDGRLVAYERGQPALSDLGVADDVFATADGQGLYVVRNGRHLVQLAADGRDMLTGPWTLPDGYDLSQPPRETAAGILLVHDSDLVAWDLPTGELQPLGQSYHLLDAHTTTDRVAWTECATGSSCTLVIAASDGLARRSPAWPAERVGVYGAAFSPTGGTLAVMLTDGVSTADGRTTAALALVDVAAGRIDIVDEARFVLGRSSPAVTWSPDGVVVYFTHDTGLAAYAPATGTIRWLPYPGLLTAVAVVP